MPRIGLAKLELLQFPHGAYLDQVDALSQYLNWTAKRPLAVGPSRPTLCGMIVYPTHSVEYYTDGTERWTND